MVSIREVIKTCVDEGRDYEELYRETGNEQWAKLWYDYMLKAGDIAFMLDWSVARECYLSAANAASNVKGWGDRVEVSRMALMYCTDDWQQHLCKILIRGRES